MTMRLLFASQCFNCLSVSNSTSSYGWPSLFIFSFLSIDHRFLPLICAYSLLLQWWSMAYCFRPALYIPWFLSSLRTVPRLLHNIRRFPSSLFRLERLFFDLIFIVFLCEEEDFFFWDIWRRRRHLNISCLYIFWSFEPDVFANFEFQFVEKIVCCNDWTH